MAHGSPIADGFSVDDLVPMGRGSGALRMGLSRIAEADWLHPAPDTALRAASFAAHPESIAVLPAAAAAAREAAALVANTPDFAAAAAQVSEDLCILTPDAQGTPRLTAAALAFPTDWHLAEKLGQPLLAIHAPIHGYAEQLASGVDHFLAQLTPGAIFARANWFVVASAAPRYLPTDDPAQRFAHVTAQNAGETLFIRCERQTLRRLPETGAVLFTIGIAVAPLGTLRPETIARIAANVAGLATAAPANAGEFERRAAPHYATPLAAWAAARTTGPMETAA